MPLKPDLKEEAKGRRKVEQLVAVEVLNGPGPAVGSEVPPVGYSKSSHFHVKAGPPRGARLTHQARTRFVLERYGRRGRPMTAAE